MLNTDILLAEILRAFVAAAFEVVVEVARKHGKRILNSLMGKSDNEADDDLEENHEKLMELAGDLLPRRDYMLARTKTKLVTQQSGCHDWIYRAKKSVDEVQELETNYKTQSQHGSSGSSTGLSRSMKKMCKELRYWLELEPRIRLQVEKLPERVLSMSKPQLVDKPFLHPIVEKIKCNLEDENVKIIALCAGPKMGKTTIMQSLNNNEDIAKIFDIVILVTVSEDLSFEKLQYIIANRLKLNMEGITSSDEIYHQICQELKSKKCLLLLDEASGSFHSSLITQYGNAKDSKVVLTARTRPDCLEMKADILIPVEPMSKTVAWEIFQEKVGQNVNIPLVKPIAELVTEECAGLPSLIDKVASKFRRRDSYDLWKEGYEILQSWSGANIDDIDQLL